MATAHGKSAELKLDDTGGTLRDLTSSITDVDFPREADLVDTSTLGDDDREYVKGLRGATVSANGFHDATIDGYLEGLLAYETATDFEYYPQGNSSGNVKLSGTLFVNSYSTSTGIGGAGTFALGCTISGAVTRALVA